MRLVARDCSPLAPQPTAAEAAWLRRLATNVCATDLVVPISGEREDAEIDYKPQVVVDQWATQLYQNRQKDLIVARTSYGPHRDDFEIKINQRPVRPFASQGQMKSCLIALKKCQLLCLQEKTDRQPIFLVDDIFDKLDQERIFAMWV